ncbi:MAG: T9SS type A sorting domain-containing protein [Burkholderiales bacterium]|nr:T9SS type A sorting domain-containing protein [Flavobacterium sp.]
MKKTTLSIVLFLFGAVQIYAQSVSGYLFTQSSEGYSPVLGTISSANGDDGAQNALAIGFGFNYAGTFYNTFSISTNGWIRLGGDVTGNSYTNVLSNASTQSPLIAAFWDDHNRTTGSIQYALSGTVPNRILEIGWDNINLGNGGNVSGTAFGSFKMRLYENSGQIDFVYGPTMNYIAGALTASIGLNDLNSFLSVSALSSIATTSNTTANNGITGTQFLIGQKFTFIPQPQCSGTPDPGNTVSSSASVCSGVDFNLSLQNATTGFGVTYQWQSSGDGISFTDILGATSPNLTTNQTTENTYQCIVTCGGVSTTSNVLPIGMINPSLCYCFPGYTNGKTDGDLISNVVITGTTLANNTGTAPVNPSYTYFTGQSNYTATLESGYSYQMNVTVGSYQDQNDAVWIDYNDDTIFSPEERVGYSEAIPSNGTGIFIITLACDAPAGLHRMRIRDVWNTDAPTIDPCANYGYGETEDYDITIVTAPGCQTPFGLGTVTVNPTIAELSWATGCDQVSWDVHLTLTGGGLPSGNPSNPNVISTLVVSNLLPATTYDFYVKATCLTNGESDWSAPFTFTTLPLAVANDDCATAISLTPGNNFQEFAVIATNVGATKTIGEPNPTCAVFGFGGDVWFSTVVPADGNITVEVQADPGSSLLDTGLTVFTGNCGNLTTIGCSDDEGIDAYSRLDLSGLTPGDVIYARVWEYANDAFGTFQVSAWSTTLKTSAFDAGSLEVFPNPVTDILNLSYSQNITNIEVYNLLGQQLISKSANSNQSKVDLSSLPKGTYLVKVRADRQLKTIKVIKQ